MQNNYDVVVIGGGPGGYAAGIRASQLGASVALLEPSDLGGTCVNRGCIPARIWNRAAKYRKEIVKANEFGIQAKVEGIDFMKITARQKGVANDIKMGMQGLCQNNKITVVRERGEITGPGTLKAGANVLNAKNIIIATGTSLKETEIPGVESCCIHTDNLFGLTEIPKSVLILGGGYVEVEMALILSGFDSKVIIAVDGGRLLPGEDSDMVQRITKTLRAGGVEIRLKSKMVSAEAADGGCRVTLSGPEPNTITVEKVLLTARKPNTAIGLESVGVVLDGGGFIKVNEKLETSAKGIYAIGDVTGGLQLSYAATAMGVAAAESAMGKERSFDSRLVPRGLWTNPESASVGLTEEEAEEQGIDIEIGECPLTVNGVAMAYGKMEGSVKVIIDSELGQILGVQIIGEHATELIWAASLAIGLEATVEDLAYSLALHPTFGETIAMAGQDAMGWALYLPRSKKK
jgi:dihydrolipoamide dehydrogenase